MLYKYITENNLEHTQNYMYSEYAGLDFLKAYYQTREPFLLENTEELFVLLGNEFSSGMFGQTATGSHLISILKRLHTEPCEDDRIAVNFYVQRFEVHKRLFAEYDAQTGRPVAGSSYGTILDYILLAAVAEKAYGSFRSLKYLNCLLKLNDTLLSLIPFKEERMLLLVKMLITREVEDVKELLYRKKIAL